MTDGQRFIEVVHNHVVTPKVIVDVGAHNGKDAIAFKEAFPDAIVLAVDPLNLDASACSAAGVLPVKVACDRRDGQRLFHLDKNESLSSAYSRGVAPNGTVTVDTLPLDSISAIPDAIKIDVEGAAWDVLKGAEKALAHARVVQLETETEAFFQGQHLEEECFFILEKAGFTKIWEQREYITATGQQTESVWVRQ